MNSALESKNQLQAEVQKLRRQVREAEERSQRAEATLKATEQRYRLLGDSAPFGIFVIDTAGRITGFNRKMAEMLQWPVQQELPSINITEFQKFIEAGKTTRSQLSLIFMDLDYFKHVVDAHGHLNGSQAIREVAATIKESIEEPAYAVAYAGDEFVVVLPGHDKDRAVEKAFNIQSHINNSVYLRGQGLAVKLQASFGVATFPDHATDLTGLLASADRALFGVKANGKSAIGWADMLV